MRRLLDALLGCNAAALRHLFLLRPAQFLRACVRAFRAAGDLSIPETTIGDILGERRPVIRLAVMRYEDGMLPSEHAMALLAVLVAEAPSVVLEIGTYMGHTTRRMAETLEAGAIHTVDLPESYSDSRDRQDIPKDDLHLIGRRVVGREFKGLPCAGRITQHFADTAVWDFHEADRPTFFFIDGSHTYEYCKNDSEKCFELCGGRGVFLWHDCDFAHPGVLKFLWEWRRKGRDIRRIYQTSIAYWKNV